MQSKNLRLLRNILFCFFGLLASTTAQAQITRDLDLAAVRRAAEQGVVALEAAEQRWLQTLERAGNEAEQSWQELFGYNPPGTALTLAYLHAFLFREQNNPADATTAAQYLQRMANYRQQVSAELLRARVEYREGLPAVPSFFHLGDYCESWIWIQDSEAIPGLTRQVIEEAIAGSADFVFFFPEWGAHNRAMLRAESLQLAARALPDHADASRWQQMAAILASDSLGQWEIEDAQLYHPIWLLSLMRYGGAEVFDSLQMRYYLRYFLELLCPLGTIPDFGDGWFHSGLPRLYACLERGAAALRDPELKWAATRVYEAMGTIDTDPPSLGHAKLYAQLAPFVNPDLPEQAPSLRSSVVLDDVIGKKVVLRDNPNTAPEEDWYLLLNFRDEGDFGLLHRDYLRHTLAVEEEKMHHGHSDENSIVLLMHEGSVLLHDAGYREKAPSGPYGAYRADVFHNRLVVRPGEPAAEQSTWEFLRNPGSYRAVRTEKIDFVRFEGPAAADYSRTRLTDSELGYRWDRTLVRPQGRPWVAVVDTVEFLSAGTFTLANLWATQEITTTGPNHVIGRTEQIGTRQVGGPRNLLIVLPSLQNQTPESFQLRRHNQSEEVVHETRTVSVQPGDFQSFTTLLWSVDQNDSAKTIAERVHGTRFLETSRSSTWIALQVDEGDGLAPITIVVKANLNDGLIADNLRPRYQPEPGRWTCADLASDADLLIARWRGQNLHWSATNMTHVHLRGEPIFNARSLQLFQVTGRSDIAGQTKWRRWTDTYTREPQEAAPAR